MPLSKYSHVFNRLVFLICYIGTKRVIGWHRDTVKDSHTCRASLYGPCWNRKPGFRNPH